MSSESDNKGGGSIVSVDPLQRWYLLVTLGILVGGLLALLSSAALGPRQTDKITLSRHVYDEMVRAIDSSVLQQPGSRAQPANSQRLGRRTPQFVDPAVAAAMAAAAAPMEQQLQQQQAWAVAQPCVPAPAAAAAAPAQCDIEKIRLGYDSRFEPKSEELRTYLGHSSYPTFEGLYKLVVNKPYEEATSIWKTFPNAYNLKPNFHFPFSNLREEHVEKVLTILQRPPKFFVEVGSFHGHSAILIAKTLDKHGHKDTPLLCVDPWTGDLGMLLFRDDWDKKLTPGELADGRSTSYWQFMLNVKNSIDTGVIGPNHIVPLATTSIVGSRYLMALHLTPDAIYLDSAHEMDETFTELTLFFNTLAPGGVVFGDDFSWESVSHDVKRFAALHNLEDPSKTTDGVTWFLIKPMR